MAKHSDPSSSADRHPSKLCAVGQAGLEELFCGSAARPCTSLEGTQPAVGLADQPMSR